MELQVEIDDVYQCPGKCPGCIISSDDRVDTKGELISEADLLLYSDRIANYSLTLNELSVVNLTYGIGDHINCSNEHLVNLYNIGSRIVSLGNIQGTIGITMALIGKTDIIKSRLLEFKNSISGDVDIAPIVVIDPLKIENIVFKKVYLDNITAVKEIFGKIEFVVNLSVPSIEAMSPSTLYDLCNKFNVEELTINWSPNKFNIESTAQNTHLVSKWLIELDKLIRPLINSNSKFIDFGYRNVMEQTIKSVNDGDAISPKLSLSSMYSNTIKHSILINHKGEVYPKMEAVGDVSYSDHFNYDPYKNIHEESISNIIDFYDKSKKAEIFRPFMYSPCKACEYSKYCITTGFHIYTKLLHSSNSDACPHVAYDLFEYYSEVSRC
jgi:MoaA/NifB/PqqE/SkfB family radical SAM enzyme